MIRSICYALSIGVAAAFLAACGGGNSAVPAVPVTVVLVAHKAPVDPAACPELIVAIMAMKRKSAAATVRKAPAEQAETAEAICRIPPAVAAAQAAATMAAGVAAAPADRRMWSPAQAA